MTQVRVDPAELESAASALTSAASELAAVADEVHRLCCCCCLPAGASDAVSAASGAIRVGLGGVGDGLASDARDLLGRAGVAANDLATTGLIATVGIPTDTGMTSLDALYKDITTGTNVAIATGQATGTGFSPATEALFQQIERGQLRGTPVGAGVQAAGLPSLLDVTGKIFDQTRIWTVPSRDEVMDSTGRYMSPSEYNSNPAYSGGYDSTLIT